MKQTIHSVVVGAVGFVLLGAVGCQSPGSSRWAGTWQAAGTDYGGTLSCVARPVEGEQWQAKFTGYCNREFAYEVEMAGREQEDRIVFEGQANLGELDGGLYTWNGELTDDAFTGEYHSESGKRGSFRMTRQ